MAKQELYTVFYLMGGWANSVCASLNPLYTAEQADQQIESLNKAGYPATKVITRSGQEPKPFFVTASDCDTDAEKQRWYNMQHQVFSPYTRKIR